MMSCKKYQRLLHLRRSSELSEQEGRKLARHLERCKSCAAMQSEVERTEALIDRARSLKPVLSEPHELTNSIMREIEGLLETGEKKPTQSWPEAFFDFLTGPKVRFTLVSAIILLVVAPLVQQTYVMYQIAKLEDKMTHRTSNPRISATVFPFLAQHVRAIWPRTEVQPLISHRQAAVRAIRYRDLLTRPENSLKDYGLMGRLPDPEKFLADVNPEQLHRDDRILQRLFRELSSNRRIDR